MIRELRIQGFKSFRDTTWKPGPLNVLIGANASGKSNLVDALLLLRESAKGRLSDAVMERGGFSAVSWNGRKEPIQFQLRTDPVDPLLLGRTDSRLTYDLALQALPHTASSYRIEQERLGNYAAFERGEKPQPFKFLERTERSAVVYDSREKKLRVQAERLSDENTLLGALRDSPIAPVPNQVISGFRDRLQGWTIARDLDVGPRSPIRGPQVTRYEPRLPEGGADLVSYLHTQWAEDNRFQERLMNALQAAFSDPEHGPQLKELRFGPGGDGRTIMRLQWEGLEKARPASEASDGTLRFLWIAALLLAPQSADLLVIEEPEQNLHPRMMAIIAELAQQATLARQVVFTTHSPEFLTAFGTVESAPCIAVAKTVDGESRLLHVAGDDLNRFLRDYSLGELFRSSELENMAQ